MSPGSSSDSVPVLTDNELLLRAHRPQDIPRIVEQVNDPASRRWLRLPDPYGPDDAAAYLTLVQQGWQSGSDRCWALDLDGSFAGNIHYRRDGNGIAELGFGMHPESRGRGLAVRAARLVLDWGFDHDDIEVFGWRAAVGNFGSLRIAWHCGFGLDGIWRDLHVNSAGRRDDQWVGGLTKDRPRRPRRPWWDPVVLAGERVRLRPWTETDAPARPPDPATATFAARLAPSPAGFQTWLTERRALMAAGAGVFWCLADPITDAALGGVQVTDLDSEFTAGSGQLGYWLDPAARGRGLLAEALSLVTAHAFAAGAGLTGRDGLGLHRLQAGTDAGNRASQRALRRAGFVECARERAVLAHRDGPPTGAVTFELLATDDPGAAPRPASIPVLSTERLRLRPWGPDDAPPADQDEDRLAALFMPAGARPTAAGFDEWLRARQDRIDGGRAVIWCLADAGTDLPLGSVMIFGIDDGSPGNAEIGYWLYPRARGNGYLAEALPAAIDHAFRPAAGGGLGLRRLHAATAAENLASQRLLLANGFRLWGQDHQSFARTDGSLSDGCYYELLRL